MRKPPPNVGQVEEATEAVKEFLRRRRFDLGEEMGKQFAERIKIAQLVIGDNASWGLVQYHADIPAELVPFAVHQIVGTLGRARPFKLRQNVSKKISNDVRDLNIVKAIKFVCKEFGFKPFQSKKTGDKHTACSIVAKALNGLGVKSLHERGVRAIWEKREFPHSDF